MSDNESYTTEDFWRDLDLDDPVDLPTDQVSKRSFTDVPSGCPGGNPGLGEKSNPHCHRMRALIRAIYGE